MSTRPSSVRPVPAITNKLAGGFILPALVVFSLVLMSVGVVSLQYITTSTGSTQANHYGGVAKSAADAGIQQAMACLEAGDYSWVGSGRTLHPNTNCSGDVQSGIDEYISEASNGSWKTTFTVEDPVEDDDGMTIISRGVVEFYYAGDVLSETYESTTKVSIPTTNVDTTYPIAQGLAVTKVTAGDNYTCAIANMRVYCSGTPADGRMGTGSTSGGNVLNPTMVTANGLGARSITDLKSGYYNTCAITNGESFCWGRGNMGQIGDNGTGTLRTPTKPNTVPGFNSFVSKASSGNSSVYDTQFMCFLSQMKLYCTGANNYAQRGRPVANRICIPFLGCGSWYLESKAFFTTGFPHFVNAGTLTPERVFGLDVSNEPSHLQGLANQSQLFGMRPTDLDSGAYTACTMANARVFCWGDRFILVNALGNDENGNTTSTKGWRDNGALSGQRVTAMDVGESTSCAVANGELYCWGQHPGNGTQKTASTFTPGWDTMGVSKATNTAGSALHNVNVEGVNMLADDVYCAYGDGDGFCWGNYTMSARTPVRFTANNGQDAITDAAAGKYHACFAANGSQYCGGVSNTYGQLGSGDTTGHAGGTTNFTRKSTVIGLTSGEAATKISAGQNHSCAVVNNFIYCWGQNNRGQLGVGDIVDRNQPYGIVGATQPKAATQVSAGYNHTCGVISGRAFCWGDNEFGQLGNGASGSGQYSDEPVAVQGLGSRKVTSIDAGRYHTCAVADSQAYCWGRNNYGQIGVTATTNQTTAQAVQGLGTDVPTQITAGDEFSCAIANAYAYCWGRNNYGQIGQGSISTLSYNSAQRLPFELTNGWTSISAGSEFVCGAINNVAKCWGRNDQGQLGRNNTTSGTANYTPANVVSSVSGQTVSWKSAVDISSGANHACAIANGDAYCWGRNASGQLGIGNTTAAPDSRLVNKASGYLDTNHAYRIAAGGDHTCIVANGKISCWGAGANGQLGDVTFTPTRTSPSAWTGSYIRQSKTIDLPNARIF